MITIECIDSREDMSSALSVQGVEQALGNLTVLIEQHFSEQVVQCEEESCRLHVEAREAGIDLPRRDVTIRIGDPDRVAMAAGDLVPDEVVHIQVEQNAFYTVVGLEGTVRLMPNGSLVANTRAYREDSPRDETATGEAVLDVDMHVRQEFASDREFDAYLTILGSVALGFAPGQGMVSPRDGAKYLIANARPSKLLWLLPALELEEFRDWPSIMRRREVPLEWQAFERSRREMRARGGSTSVRRAGPVQ